MKKKLLFISIIFTLLFTVFSQEALDNPEDDAAHEFTRAEGFADFIHSLDFVIQTEPGIYLNKESNLVSAPSPVIYPLSIGILWPNYTIFAVQPTLSIFTTEWLWYENKALPAEIENRTATSLSFILTIPASFCLYLKGSRIQLNAGISILAQFGFLSSGVNAEDYGYSGSAGSDVELINKYFWSDLNYLYLNTSFSWLFNVHATKNSMVKAGPVINVNMPIGHLTSDAGMQGVIITAGLKISL